MKSSFAGEILTDYKRANKRQFIIILVLLAMLSVSVIFNIYLASDTGVIDETIEIEDVETIDNSHIKIGDDIWERSE